MMASVPLYLPKNEELAARYDMDGYSIALVQSYDQLQRRVITRVDMLCGLVAVRPEYAVRVTA